MGITGSIAAYKACYIIRGLIKRGAEVQVVITPAGKETKIILLGDPNQIDRPYLDERTNGLSYAAEHMKGSPLCWQVTLLPEECERSVLATDAIRRL